MNDKQIEQLLNVLSPFVVNSLEEVVSFDSRGDEEREEILKVALRSLEIAAILTSKFYDSKSFNAEKLGNVQNALKKGKFEEAASYLN